MSNMEQTLKSFIDEQVPPAYKGAFYHVCVYDYDAKLHATYNTEGLQELLNEVMLNNKRQAF